MAILNPLFLLEAEKPPFNSRQEYWVRKCRDLFKCERFSPLFRTAFVIGITWFTVVLSISGVTFEAGASGTVTDAPGYYALGLSLTLNS